MSGAPEASPLAAQEPAEAAQAGWAARFFLLRPTFALLLSLLLVVGGVLAYGFLTKESMPDLAIPQATVATVWAGADPQTIEQEVTEPLEKALKTLKGLKSITSASFDSSSIIAVEFDASVDLSEAMQRLRAKVSEAEAELPAGALASTINQVSVDDRPIMTVVLFGDLDSGLLSRTAQDLQDRLERVRGVNDVGIGGLREEVVLIQLIPERMLGLGISPTRVRDAVTAANVDMPWGAIEGDQISATVRLFGRFRDISDLERLPVARLRDHGSGRIVRLGEVARVRRDLEQESARASFSSGGSAFRTAVEVSIKKTPGADTIGVIAEVRAALDEAREGATWPVALDYQVTQDESKTIWKSLTDVFHNAWQAMLAVFVVLFVLLTWREGLIAGLSIPLTFMGALVVLWALGNTLNELVIIGMVLALGLLVDVFILMMEGMHEGIFVERLSFEGAVLATVRRYAVPAIAGTATTILALAPLMAIGGVAGKFIRVLPATAIACLSVALVVAMACALPLSRYLLGRMGEAEERTTRVDQITAGVMARMRAWSLATTLRSRWTAGAWTAAAFGVFVLSSVGFSQVPAIMYPKGDGLKLGITIELPASTQLEESQEVADRIGEILREKPYFASVVALVGKKSPMASGSLQDALSPSVASHFVGFSCIFVPRGERSAPGYEIADRLRDELRPVIESRYAGTTLLLVPETGQPSAAAPIQIELAGDDMNQLRALSQQVQSLLEETAGTVDVRDSLGSVQPEIRLIPRREALSFHGLTERDLGAQVRFAMANDEIAKFATGGLQDDLSIRLGTLWPSRKGEVGGPTRSEEFAMVRAFLPDGSTVPMLSILEPRIDTAPLSITHVDGRRSLSVVAKTDGRAASEIVKEVEPRLRALAKQDWPPGYSFSFGGETEEAAETFASAGAMLLIAIFLVFALLVLLFDSFAQALIIVATMPLALIGTFGGFYLLGIPFSFFAMVGLISLIGIVVNDTIVMITTMNEHLAAGIEVRVAAARGASDRLRPILSTTLTTIAGLVPLAVTNPMWRPLCYAIIFGLTASTVTSLVVVPCLYFLFTHPGKRSDAAETALGDPGPAPLPE